jgi:hypothetical protein
LNQRAADRVQRGSDHFFAPEVAEVGKCPLEEGKRFCVLATIGQRLRVKVRRPRRHRSIFQPPEALDALAKYHS